MHSPHVDYLEPDMQIVHVYDSAYDISDDSPQDQHEDSLQEMIFDSEN